MESSGVQNIVENTDENQAVAELYATKETLRKFEELGLTKSDLLQLSGVTEDLLFLSIDDLMNFVSEFQDIQGEPIAQSATEKRLYLDVLEADPDKLENFMRTFFEKKIPNLDYAAYQEKQQQRIDVSSVSKMLLDKSLTYSASAASFSTGHDSSLSARSGIILTGSLKDDVQKRRIASTASLEGDYIQDQHCDIDRDFLRILGHELAHIGHIHSHTGPDASLNVQRILSNEIEADVASTQIFSMSSRYSQHDASLGNMEYFKGLDQRREISGTLAAPDYFKGGRMHDHATGAIEYKIGKKGTITGEFNKQSMNDDIVAPSYIKSLAHIALAHAGYGNHSSSAVSLKEELENSALLTKKHPEVLCLAVEALIKEGFFKVGTSEYDVAKRFTESFREQVKPQVFESEHALLYADKSAKIDFVNSPKYQHLIEQVEDYYQKANENLSTVSLDIDVLNITRLLPMQLGKN